MSPPTGQGTPGSTLDDQPLFIESAVLSGFLPGHAAPCVAQGWGEPDLTKLLGLACDLTRWTCRIGR